jgi:tetratricopeptide (TPR) repeat protein
MSDEAIAEFKKVIAINPNYKFVHYNLGVSYSKKGMKDEAIAEYKKAIEINPDDAFAHYNLGIHYGIKGKYVVAADHYYQAGLLCLKQGKREKALEAYQALKKYTKSEKLQKSLFKQLYPEVK